MTAHFSLVNYAITLSFLLFFWNPQAFTYMWLHCFMQSPADRKALTYLLIYHISVLGIKKTFHVSNKIELFPQWISPYSEQSPWILFTIHNGLTDVLNNLNSKLFINIIALLMIAKYWETSNCPALRIKCIKYGTSENAILHACVLSRFSLFETLWTVAHQAPLSMGFSRQEY